MAIVERAHRAGPAGGSSLTDLTLADVAERLMSEFEDRFDLASISRVVQTARHDLAAVPVGSVPELVERLARQRLMDQAADVSAVPVPVGP